MKVVQVSIPGGPEALQYTEVPTPAPAAHEILVRAHMIGVGRFDVLIRNGTYKWMPALPAIPGAELAGTVEAVGSGVMSIKAGARVLVSARELPERGRCYAEYICIPAEGAYSLPDSIEFEAAVSLQNFQTAYALLHEFNEKRATRSILLPGAAGGIAGALTQLARHAGIEVIGTVSTEEKRAFALANGVSHVIMYKDENVTERVLALTGGRGVDVAFDHVGGKTMIDCIRALAPRGVLISYNAIAGLPDADVFKEMQANIGRSLGVHCVSMHTFDNDTAKRRALMDKVITLMAQGRVRAPKPMVLPLADARKAHEILDAGATMGKIALVP